MLVFCISLSTLDSTQGAKGDCQDKVYVMDSTLTELLEVHMPFIMCMSYVNYLYIPFTRKQCIRRRQC